MRTSTGPEGLAAYYETSASIDLRQIVPNIAARTLVIHEPAFPFGSLKLCEQVAKSISAAHLLVVHEQSIAGTAHEGHVSAIDDFLRSGAVTRLPTAAGRGLYGPTVSGTLLTPREIQVLGLVASGLANKQVADDLGLAVATVERHVANIYTKIGARGRVDATAYAIRHGLAKASPDQK
jgi:DNA-binding CsgD family transcriptional regulator